MESIKNYYKEQMKKYSMFEKFLIFTAVVILSIILVFKWFIHIRLTVMDGMKPEFRYRDYVVHEPATI